MYRDTKKRSKGVRFWIRAKMNNSYINPLHLAFATAIAMYFVFQQYVSIPPEISAYCMLAWCVCIFLDLHSSMRSPSMMKHETNPLFAFMHRRLAWLSVPIQIFVEILILSVASILLSNDNFIQTFGLACVCSGTLHAWYWRKNEIFRDSLKKQIK